ncbi:MAG TPA: sigma-70 factor domain-containing protein, partial [Anaerolineae bacterium]
MDLDPEVENGEIDDFDDIAEIEDVEPDFMDIEALVKKARRSREIDEADVQALLASADEEQADRLYERLHKLDIRIVSASGETLEDFGDSKLLEAFDDDVDDIGDTSYLSATVEDDPVHTYLKEIGQVPLLTAEQEIWLSTQLSAALVLDELTQNVASDEQREEDVDFQAMMANYASLLESWQFVAEAAATLGVEQPHFPALVAEASQLRQNWREATESYLRRYLNDGNWGQDDTWSDLAQGCFKIFTALYLLPTDLAQRIGRYY